MDQLILGMSLQFLTEADAVLIGAGAGLTAAAGVNYMDKLAFSTHFPAWKKRGFTMQYQLMGYRGWSIIEQWSYYTVHLGYVYFGQGKNEIYQSLRNVIDSKPYFVMTSNVDGLFQKNDFDKDNMYEPQGSYGKIQCIQPCSKTVWNIKPFYDKMVDALDPISQLLTDDKAVPKCPNCGEDMFIHARIDSSFIDEEHQEEVNRLNTWLSNNSKRNILIIEIGAGFNTPMVIRHPMEELHKNLEHSNFIRINLDHAEIENGNKENTLSYQGDITTWLNAVSKNII